MLFAKKIIRLTPIIGLVFFLTPTQAQINSPFSRYGLGNEVFNNQNAASQGMGGFTTAYTSSMNGSYGQSVNFNNPASYGSIYLTTFDIGININSYTLKRADPVGREKSNYMSPNYLAIGVPINKAKKIGMAFGLRPISQINYSINEISYLKATGDSILNNGDIDRRALGELIFKNPDAKKKLESIIHPFVRREFEGAVASLKSDETLVYEIPLLVETGAQDRFDIVVTVESLLENRVSRLRQRGMHISEIEGRIASQATREQRIEVADFLIENDGSEDELLRQVENIWDSLHDNK